jgi:hypothetical protein
MEHIKNSIGLNSRLEIRFSLVLEFFVNPRLHNKIIILVIYRASKLELQVKFVIMAWYFRELIVLD